MEDEQIKKLSSYVIGQNLDEMSVEELDQSIELLKAEIDRLKSIRTAKSSHISAAEAFFIKK